MTDFTKGIIVIVLLWISELRLISSSSPYCEFDTCDETEFCCQDYECCKKPNDNIYVITWILTGLLIVLICFVILYRCKNRLYRFFSKGSESESLTNPKV